MADIIVDGMTRVAFVPTISNLAAATTTELNNGTLLTLTLVPTGLEGFDSSQADVDNSSLGSTYDSKLPGRKSFSGTGLVLKKQDGTDAVFNLLSVANTNGFIVVRDGLDQALAWLSAQPYEVYPIRTGEFNFLGRGEANSLLRYRVPTSISASRVRGAVA